MRSTNSIVANSVECFFPETIFPIFWTLYCLYQLLQKSFYCNDSKIKVFEMIDAKNSSTVVIYKLIT